jgi:hypothetical protein
MKALFAFNKSERKWHLPVVTGLSVGIPMIFGWYFDIIEAGKLASLAGLSILYIQSHQLAERMILLMTCCFGIMTCFAIGLLFSYNIFLAPIAFGLLTFGVNYSLHKLHLTKPPGNFFFIMLASMAICTPFEFENIPTKIGYIALGTIFTCLIALIYSLFTLKENRSPATISSKKEGYTHTAESIIFGVFMLISLTVAFSFPLDNPYWIPISCIAVMQGSSSKHTWHRGLERIIGTLIGLGFTWLIAYANPTPFFMVISITLLQMIIEFFVVRNYTIAVIFITILTIFLAESSNQLSQNIDKVFLSRLVDILIGSVIGIIGGWVLYHEKVRHYARFHRRKTGS